MFSKQTRNNVAKISMLSSLFQESDIDSDSESHLEHGEVFACANAKCCPPLWWQQPSFFFWTMFAYCPNLCSQLYDFLYSLYALYSHTVTCHPSAGYSPFLMTVIFTNNKKRKRLRLIKVLYDLKFLKGKKSMTSIICEQIKTCIAYAFKLDCTAVCQQKKKKQLIYNKSGQQKRLHQMAI